MRKKLLLATDAFLPRWDGVARFIANITPLLKREFDVTILAPDFGSENIKAKKIKFPIVNFEIGGYPFPRPDSKRIFEEVRKADIVFVQTIGPIGAKTLKAAKKLGKPSVSYMHSIEWDLIPNALPFAKGLRRLIVWGSKLYSKKIYGRADIVMVPGTEALWHARQIGIKTKTRLARLGIDTDQFRPAKDKKAIRKRLGLDPDEFIIGYVGRISRDKDIPTLVKAFRKFNKIHPKSKLAFIGKPIKTYELLFKSHNIIFFGPQKDVLPYFQAMDVFALPSLHETTSLVTIEAMSCGLPVVVTPMGGIKEYVLPGRNGLLFPPRNRKQLLKHLENLYDDKRFRDRLGREARKTIVKDYDWKKNSKKIIDILKEVKT